MATKKEFDIFAHELVPEHRILSEEETKELLRRYRIQISQLPQIKLRTRPWWPWVQSPVTFLRSKGRAGRQGTITTIVWWLRTDSEG